MQNRLLALRTERRWSQLWLNEQIDEKRQTVISLERGRFDPSLPLAFNLATLFGCRIEDIFTPEPWSPQE